jgi:hypothetical protein
LALPISSISLAPPRLPSSRSLAQLQAKKELIIKISV